MFKGLFIRRNEKLASRIIHEEGFAAKWGLREDEAMRYLGAAAANRFGETISESEIEFVKEYNYKLYQLRQEHKYLDADIPTVYKKVLGVDASYISNKAFYEFKQRNLENKVAEYENRFDCDLSGRDDILHIWDNRYYLVSRFLFGALAHRNCFVEYAGSQLENFYRCMAGPITAQYASFEEIKNGSAVIHFQQMRTAFRDMYAGRPTQMFYNAGEDTIYLFGKIKYGQILKKLLKRMAKLECAADVNTTAKECFETESEIVPLKLLLELLKVAVDVYDETTQGKEMPDEILAEFDILRSALSETSYTSLYLKLSSLKSSWNIMSLGDRKENDYKLLEAYIRVAAVYTQKIFDKAGVDVQVPDLAGISAMSDEELSVVFDKLWAVLEHVSETDVKFMSVKEVTLIPHEERMGIADFMMRFAEKYVHDEK